MLKKISILLLISSSILVSGCSKTDKSDMPGGQELTRLQTEQTMDIEGLKIITKTSPVRRGETVTLTMQGKPGITYTVTSTYKRGERSFTAYQHAKADKDGIARWSWTVAADTVPGTYPLMITGGDDTLVSSYEVLK